MSSNGFPPMVIMGVSGSGKSTVGELLGRRLGVPFIDGDDLHPAADKEKMRAGIPLEDDDRQVLLDARQSPAELADQTAAAAEGLAAESTTAAAE